MTRPLGAPSRLDYIQHASEQVGCVFCAEGAGELADDESLVVGSGENTFVLLNKFPYAAGHIMVAPLRPRRRVGHPPR